jgi:hypothetical protein
MAVEKLFMEQLDSSTILKMPTAPTLTSRESALWKFRQHVLHGTTKLSFSDATRMFSIRGLHFLASQLSENLGLEQNKCAGQPALSTPLLF